MSASEVLAWLELAGVELKVRGGKLEWEAPMGVVGEREVGLLRSHKSDLMELLLERVRTPAKVLQTTVKQMQNQLGSVLREVPTVAVRTVLDAVGEGGVDDAGGVRKACLASAEACGWPALALPGRPAESVAAGWEAWGLFCEVAEVGLVGAAHKRLRVG